MLQGSVGGADCLQLRLYIVGVLLSPLDGWQEASPSAVCRRIWVSMNPSFPFFPVGSFNSV